MTIDYGELWRELLFQIEVSVESGTTLTAEQRSIGHTYLRLAREMEAKERANPTVDTPVPTQ